VVSDIATGHATPEAAAQARGGGTERRGACDGIANAVELLGDGELVTVGAPEFDLEGMPR
jgi:hypothetical protein